MIASNAFCLYTTFELGAQSKAPIIDRSWYTMQLTTVEGVEVDISLGSDDGVKAAEIIKLKLKEYPEAKPLTILLKAFLKARRLTDVSQGGLGGYSLVNMVIAHLQEEKKVSSTAMHTVLCETVCLVGV